MVWALLKIESIRQNSSKNADIKQAMIVIDDWSLFLDLQASVSQP